MVRYPLGKRQLVENYNCIRYLGWEGLSGCVFFTTCVDYHYSFFLVTLSLGISLFLGCGSTLVGEGFNDRGGGFRYRLSQ